MYTEIEALAPPVMQRALIKEVFKEITHKSGTWDAGVTDKTSSRGYKSQEVVPGMQRSLIKSTNPRGGGGQRWFLETCIHVLYSK